MGQKPGRTSGPKAQLPREEEQTNEGEGRSTGLSPSDCRLVSLLSPLGKAQEVQEFLERWPKVAGEKKPRGPRSDPSSCSRVRQV